MKVTIECEEIKLKKEFEIHSAKLEKAISPEAKKFVRPVVKEYRDDILEFFIQLWESKGIEFEQRNGIEHLGEYLYEIFDFRKIKNPAKELEKGALMTELYNIRKNL